MEFKGVIPPVITPHHDDGAIDKDGLAVMIDFLIDNGVHGLIVGGTTGEYYAQSHDERIALFGLTHELVRQRCPLIAGIAAIRTADCIDYGLAAKAAGCDAILVSSPYYAVPTQLELANHALQIDRAVNLPIMLYNYPHRTGTLMQDEFFDRVGASHNVRAIKESSGDINQLHLLAREYPHIDLFCGMDDQALEFFAWGAKGWVCGGGNCLPREHVALYEACVINNDFVRGRQIMAALLPFMRILEQSGKFIQSIKHACRLQGLPSGPVRQPLRELTKEQKRELNTVLSTLRATLLKLGVEPTGAAQ
ncbi:MAG: dihydrodipicolinate synthase family protein [Pseudomonadota bacterium]